MENFVPAALHTYKSQVRDLPIRFHDCRGRKF
jgi:hypothetical protein